MNKVVMVDDKEEEKRRLIDTAQIESRLKPSEKPFLPFFPAPRV